METLIVLGSILIMMIPFSLALYINYSAYNEQAGLLQAERTAEQLANMADIVASSGPGTVIKTRVDVPSNIEQVSTTNKEIVISVRSSAGKTEIVKITRPLINGHIDSIRQGGSYEITIEYEQTPSNEPQVRMTV